MEQSEKIRNLLTSMTAAASNCALYSKTHPAVSHFSGKAVRLMADMFENDEIRIIMPGSSLFVNNSAVGKRGEHICGLISRLKRKGMDMIVIKKGITVAEFIDFIANLSSSGAPQCPMPSIAAGSVEAGAGPKEPETAKDTLSNVKEVYAGLAEFGKMNTSSLEEAVMGFIAALRREANVLSVLTPVRSYDEYTYVHVTNVTILSMFQAESLGLRGDVLHDIGMAGLLHDVGKMSVSKGVLNKPEKLNALEWAEMKKHPAYGAMYLSAFHGVPKLAVLVAFEHHMKFDGSGYPDTKIRGRSQHTASQIVAISDFFDALRTERPYRKALDIPVIFGLMEEAAGKDFNPELVKNFIHSMKSACNI